MLAFGTFLLSCSTKHQNNTAQLGVIDFEVSTDSAEAIAHFERGVLLLHSFMYFEAAQSFLSAQESDPDFALAYWGEAMTYDHPIWGNERREDALASLDKLASSPEARQEKAITAFEKDLLQSVEILYGEGDKETRDKAYAAHMEKLHGKYPNNHEIAAFYSLALIGAVHEGRDYEVYGKAAEVAQEVLNTNPEHPGALHYLIHSYDDPEHAQLALAAANSYSKVAPDAGHALHMPSHIYLAMGMWDEVVTANYRSFEASFKKSEERGNLRWDLHSYRWLLYGYLQQGEFQKADELMVRMQEFLKKNDAKYVRGYFLEMLAGYCAESNNWTNAYTSIEVETDDLYMVDEVVQVFILGMKALEMVELDAAEAHLLKMKAIVEKAQNLQVTSGITSCNVVSRASSKVTQSQIDRSQVLTLLFEAKLAEANHESAETMESLYVEAIELDSTIPFRFGPPVVYPSHEFYAEWLLRQKRYDESIQHFEKSLELAPGRRTALDGIEKAKKLRMNS